jgi:DNA-binding transcriptional regulator LsrR (DeoR family)
MYEFASALPERPLAADIFPLALIADQSLEVRSVDAPTLVNTLWYKFRPNARAQKLSLNFPAAPFTALRELVMSSRKGGLLDEFSRSLDRSDVLFFSASHLRKDSQIIDLAQASGSSFQDLVDLGIVGDYLFQTLDHHGHAVPSVQDYVVSPTLEALTALAADGKRRVVLVAGGREKRGVIGAGLKARLFNSLITDEETARKLLEDEGVR